MEYKDVKIENRYLFLLSLLEVSGLLGVTIL